MLGRVFEELARRFGLRVGEAGPESVAEILYANLLDTAAKLGLFTTTYRLSERVLAVAPDSMLWAALVLMENAVDYDYKVEARLVYVRILGRYEARLAAGAWGFDGLREAVEKYFSVREALWESLRRLVEMEEIAVATF